MALKNQDTPANAVPSMNYFGLTKLEAFTMAAMQGLCSNLQLKIETKYARISESDEFKAHSSLLAEMSVVIAKYTLDELEKPEGGENDKA
ncbi:MAG TPA: hypothetical protein PK289_01255 [Bacteroidia bacterium]|nr:hypothetical protein [Bacteroidia bacterium]